MRRTARRIGPGATALPSGEAARRATRAVSLDYLARHRAVHRRGQAYDRVRCRLHLAALATLMIMSHDISAQHSFDVSAAAPYQRDVFWYFWTDVCVTLRFFIALVGTYSH